MIKMRHILISLLALTMGQGLLTAQYSSGSDAGQYLIQSAQYGTARRHVDVTARLRDLARQDVTFRMGNSTFGVDPDPGQVKALRIYARGLNGESRMFEYREGSVINGNMFRGWNGGDWGNGNWNGRWEGDGDNDRDDRYASGQQPEMAAAIQNLREARLNLERGSRGNEGRRARALQLVNEAIQELQSGTEYDNSR